MPKCLSFDIPCDSTYQPLDSNTADNANQATEIIASLSNIEDAPSGMDWFELFNAEGDDLIHLTGSLRNPDYLNPQNLALLYRFL